MSKCKSDYFTFLPPMEQIAHAYSQLPPDETVRTHNLNIIATRIVEHSNEIKKVLGDNPDLSLLSQIQ